MTTNDDSKDTQIAQGLGNSIHNIALSDTDSAIKLSYIMDKIGGLSSYITSIMFLLFLSLCVNIFGVYKYFELQHAVEQTMEVVNQRHFQLSKDYCTTIYPAISK